MAFFIREKASGRLSKFADEAGMASFCTASIQGAMLLGKVKRNAHVVEKVAEQALAHLQREIVPSTAVRPFSAGVVNRA